MGLFKRSSSSSYDLPRDRSHAPYRVVEEHAGMSHPLYTGPKAGTKIEKGNPNPKNYRLKRSWRCGVAPSLKTLDGRYLVVEINYPDCTNYEGNKILVYEDTRLIDLMRQGSIDPHFTNNPKFKAPIARFVPTQAGWEMAKQFCILMSNLRGYNGR